MSDVKNVSNTKVAISECVASSKSSLLSAEELLSAVGGELLCAGAGEFCFSSVQTDSRKVVDGSLFVPLIGEVQDGHSYIPSAIQNGARVVLVSRKTPEIDSFIEAHGDVAFIFVRNTLKALQAAAGRYVEKFPSLVKVSVTGSSGKTTTKELLASILGQKYNVISNVGNLNSETGLPLSVFNIRPEHTLGLFEMGMNREDEIGEIAGVFKPNYAVITNIGTAHIGILKSRENIAREKKKIFSFVDEKGVCVIPKHDDFASFLCEGVKGKVVFYGPDVDCRISFLGDDGLLGTRFSVCGLPVRLALPGRYNYSNALGAIALSLELGLSPEEIKKGIESLPALSGRSEIVREKNFTILKDCYNANPDSMEKALELSASVDFGGKKILVLGDMLELGEESKSAHEKAGELSASCRADCVIFIGNEMKHGFERAKEVSGKNAQLLYIEGNGQDAMKKACEAIRSASSAGGDNFLLLKGSRGMGLERICEEL
ncbi:MAG: UDP-N-acetylmuramoyl-tripeptide--D-alanyl-D-alanine ligase [Treponema sp.]|nr:UDP-N-acetylmuramoyl-tripeptide--D-alanyl-D-alanine ligase [Treponema sp.]